MEDARIKSRAETPKRARTRATLAITPPDLMLGSRIKALRISRKMSLQDLVRLSGVSIGTLSQIERDLANPSFRTLIKIQNALGASFTTLFPRVPPRGDDPDFVRRKDRRPFCDLGHLTKELISTGSSNNLEMMILHLPPGGSTGAAPLTSPSEKAGLVLAGEVVLRVDDRSCIMTEGDSFVFDGRALHSLRNEADQPARVLWIITSIPMDRHL